jgi:hypothetical protein
MNVPCEQNQILSKRKVIDANLKAYTHDAARLFINWVVGYNIVGDFHKEESHLIQ